MPTLAPTLFMAGQRILRRAATGRITADPHRALSLCSQRHFVPYASASRPRLGRFVDPVGVQITFNSRRSLTKTTQPRSDQLDDSVRPADFARALTCPCSRQSFTGGRPVASQPQCPLFHSLRSRYIHVPQYFPILHSTFMERSGKGVIQYCENSLSRTVPRSRVS